MKRAANHLPMLWLHAGTLSTLTGGGCYHYGRYAASRDNLGFRQEVMAAIQRPFVYDCVMRVRTSAGLKVVEHFGHFHTKNGTDLEIAGMDAAKGAARENVRA